MTKKDEKPTKKVSNQVTQLQQQNEELTADLQRVRADFENYRKRTEAEVAAARQAGGDSMILKLLPVIDTLERAIRHLPAELADNTWAQGVAGVAKNLDKIMSGLDIVRIDTVVGKEFDPELHYAVQVDDAAEGESEVIAEELQAGYIRNGVVLRHAMVKVTRQ